jgi:hypothetical protein
LKDWVVYHTNISLSFNQNGNFDAIIGYKSALDLGTILKMLQIMTWIRLVLYCSPDVG